MPFAARVLSFFVCKPVAGTSYLVADFSVVCGGARWTAFLPVAIACTLVYPVGVPLLVLSLLIAYRKRLDEPDIQASLGFLYNAFHSGKRFFEVADMAVVRSDC